MLPTEGGDRRRGAGRASTGASLLRALTYPLRLALGIKKPSRAEYLQRELTAARARMLMLRSRLAGRYPGFYSKVADPLLSAITAGPRVIERRLWRRRRREDALRGARRVEDARSSGGRIDWFLPASRFSDDVAAFRPSVTVVVPSYNHARYLPQRLDCIFGQTYEAREVLLLDDCSSDGSREILESYARRFPDRARLLFNDTNSGGAFRQWARGIREASSDLVWIAESDDYCDMDFLERLIGYFRDDSVMLAYSRSRFVDAKGRASSFTFDDYLDEVSPGRWDSSYVETAHQEVQAALGLKNTIPNVSSVVFRRAALDRLLDDRTWMDLCNCGDWIVYLRCIRGGKLAYCAETTSYFRFHALSSSKTTYAETIYYEEHERVASEILRLYPVPLDVIERNRSFVRRFFDRNGGALRARGISFDALFDLDRVSMALEERKPNAMIGCFGFTTGGGEVFALRLARGLMRQGYAVTLFDYQGEPPNPKLRDSIPGDMPVVERSSLPVGISDLCTAFGVDVVNTHHARVDEMFAVASGADGHHVPLVVTLHGMYEAMTPGDFRRDYRYYGAAVDHWVYIAAKNLEPFKRESVYSPERFTRIPNGMEPPVITRLDRADFGVPDDAFLVCVASRAIAEKGWPEAIEIVRSARDASGADIHLILVGDGPAQQALDTSGVPGFVHLLGYRPDVPSLFAMSDLGMLPSRFKGESFPLVIIECLMVGRPILASDLGESRTMILGEGGESAGDVLPLAAGGVDVEGFVDKLVVLVRDRVLYERQCSLASRIACRFAMSSLVRAYGDVYTQAISHARACNPERR